VNFYKRYPGDYRKKTARLTLAQHGAYTLLLDEIYLTEQGLPAAFDELYRICSAMTEAEQEAARFVAERLFPIGEDGLRHNERAIEEIEAARPAIEAARANGKKGGRPRKEPTGFSDGNPDETQTEPRSKAPHSPDTSTSLRSVEGRASRLPKPFDLPEDWAAWAKGERPELDPERVAEKFADYWHGKAGAAGRKLDWQATWRNWVREERAAAAPRNGGYGGHETPYQRSMRERTEQITPRIAAKAPGVDHNVIEMEVPNVIAGCLGR
jgi:uncharacterized protein YdaU (DUF1376 family)